MKEDISAMLFTIFGGVATWILLEFIKPIINRIMGKADQIKIIVRIGILVKYLAIFTAILLSIDFIPFSKLFACAISLCVLWLCLSIVYDYSYSIIKILIADKENKDLENRKAMLFFEYENCNPKDTERKAKLRKQLRDLT